MTDERMFRTQTWHASCKELRNFLNHVSGKAQYSSVVFLEADFEKDSMRVGQAPTHACTYPACHRRTTVRAM